ncbi:PINIT domain-containing protein [Chlamydoabsidia padenii]|nr:PINIT domain-containing protein [Chlamydoabsidia padenii]
MDESQARMLDSYLNGYLVPDIKRLITILNERFYTRISRTSRKAILVGRIVEEVIRRVEQNQCEILDVLVAAMNTLKHVTLYERVDKHIELRRTSSLIHSQNIPLTSTATTTVQINLQYKPSPFYTIQARLAQAKVFPINPNTRSSRYLQFGLTPAQVQLFDERYPGDGRPLYEIRFFCTDYDAQHTTHSCAKEVEFPLICEIKVNSEHTIGGNALRGMKNKPGTTNPADLTFACHLSTIRNTIEFVYAQTMKPFAGSIELVKRIPIPDIVKHIKETNIISKENTLKKLEELEEDNDIVLESETISTKCPLGFTRIQTPSRSIHCQHLQCFDASTFLMMNQQTPTWCCPICNRKMESLDEVGVDEYFQDILTRVSDKVESIRIEEGGKFTILVEEEGNTPDNQSDGDGDNTKRGSSVDHDKNDKATDSVTILDDDSELEGQPDPDDIPLAKRQKTTQSNNITEMEPSSHSRQVIDLTIDSDEEEEEEENEDDNHVDNELDDGQQNDTTSDDRSTLPYLPSSTRSSSSASSTTTPTSTNESSSHTGAWDHQHLATVSNTPSKNTTQVQWYVSTDNGETDSPSSPTINPTIVNRLQSSTGHSIPHYSSHSSPSLGSPSSSTTPSVNVMGNYLHK